MKPSNPLLKKKADVGGFDLRVREDMEKAGDPRVEEPMEHPLAQKGTEPVEEEINNHEFFKEGEEGDVEAALEASEPAAAVDEIGDPFQNALKALEELAATTDDDDTRECCRATIQDLEYFHGEQHGAEAKVGATQSFGTVPPLGAPPVNPQTPTAPTAPKIETPKTKAPADKAVPGRMMTKEQAETLNQIQQTAAVEMHKTPTSLPPRDDMRSHLDQSVKDEVMQGVDKPVKVGVEVEEDATQTCPNCNSSNYAVADEEDGEKLIECSDCGSFFTL